MKLLIKSVYLFIFGAYVEFSKKRFDALMDKCIKSGGDISSPSLTKRSNRCYSLYERFLARERDLRFEMSRQRARI